MIDNQYADPYTRIASLQERCARLQQALREIAEIDERDDSRPIFFGLQNAFFKAQRIAREALAGPDTAADICPECAKGVHVACLDDGSSVWTDRCKCGCGDTPADSQEDKT